jgi:hypothetical protein
MKLLFNIFMLILHREIADDRQPNVPGTGQKFVLLRRRFGH